MTLFTKPVEAKTAYVLVFEKKKIFFQHSVMCCIIRKNATDKDGVL